MTPVEPAVLHHGGQLVVFGKDQPEYQPLPASLDATGLVMTEWEPTAEELEALLTGARVRLWIWKGAAHMCEACGTITPARLTPVKLTVTALPEETT